jgi:hypothetical protein
MRKVIFIALILIVALAAVLPAAAAPPCNDTNGDGSPSGYEYAQYHISPAAQAGALGAGGHIPGTHQGFSVCQ